MFMFQRMITDGLLKKYKTVSFICRLLFQHIFLKRAYIRFILIPFIGFVICIF